MCMVIFCLIMLLYGFSDICVYFLGVVDFIFVLYVLLICWNIWGGVD